MASNIEMTDAAKKASADGVAKVLADTYVLYLKTHNFHWNVEGPQFKALHEMFEEQYSDLWNTVDELAERIRALGEYAPGTHARFHELAAVKEAEGVPTAHDMLRQLVADNETVARTIRAALATAQDAADEASAGMLTDRLATHEKQVWMMKSLMS